VSSGRTPNESETDFDQVDSESVIDDDVIDFYNETTFTPEWLKLSDDEKRKKLDDDLDKYMGRDVSQIKC
jgi:hypothetical protein